MELVKRNVKATTLAIGDGANDVSMIKGIMKIVLIKILLMKILLKLLQSSIKVQ